MLNFHIVTIFPEVFGAYFEESIIKRAIKNKKISVSFYNPKDYAEKSNNPNLSKPIDDSPFGGGPGMVLKATPFLKAIEKAVGKKTKFQIVYFSPRGSNLNTESLKVYNNKYEEKELKDIILVSGRYEGIDSRVEEIFPGKRVSIGDYVLTGGELPSMVFIDSLARQISGVLGNQCSLEEDRVSAGEFYTKPATLKWKKKEYSVPKVLLSGNHAEIDKWRKNH